MACVAGAHECRPEAARCQVGLAQDLVERVVDGPRARGDKWIDWRSPRGRQSSSVVGHTAQVTQELGLICRTMGRKRLESIENVGLKMAWGEVSMRGLFPPFDKTGSLVYNLDVVGPVS